MAFTLSSENFGKIWVASASREEVVKSEESWYKTILQTLKIRP